MEQLLAHLVGDYILQSDWMALNKRRSDLACWCHAILYSLCFVPLLWGRHLPGFAWFFICSTHFLIDRHGLARYVVWAKNWLGVVPELAEESPLSNPTPEDELIFPRYWVTREAAGKDWTPPFPPGWQKMPWAACKATGYPPNRDAWLTVWLLIIADNTLHLLINYFVLRYISG